MKTAAQAAALLAAASLGADPHQVVNPARPPFRVYDQTPAAGASVPVGSVVQYTIARPAGGGLRTVPDLVGNTQGQASIEVATAGLTIDFDHVSTGAHPAGRVYAQSPAAGSSVPAGTVVRARVATPAGPATVAVPNLIGLASGAARAALEARGLVSDGRVVLRPDKPLHRVYSQSRVAGSHVAPGTTIRWRANP
jgi:hypothetical protein